MEKSERVAYAKQLIQRLNYLTLATSSREGQPWNSPVFGAYDDNGIFYWGSRIDAQHSQNIVENSRGFIVVYDSTIAPGHGEAVYAQVVCKELMKSEINQAIKLLHAKLGDVYMNPADVQGTASRRLYKATTIHAWIKDPKRDVREEIDLV
jgi:hypothetical protein